MSSPTLQRQSIFFVVLLTVHIFFVPTILHNSEGSLFGNGFDKGCVKDSHLWMFPTAYVERSGYVVKLVPDDFFTDKETWDRGPPYTHDGKYYWNGKPSPYDGDGTPIGRGKYIGCCSRVSFVKLTKVLWHSSLTFFRIFGQEFEFDEIIQVSTSWDNRWVYYKCK